MAEASVLQKELHKLCCCLDPVVLSTALFAKEIIDDRAWEEARQNGPIYDRCLKLMATVLRKTKACPAVFDDFCNILEDETITENIGAELRSSCVKERKHKIEFNSPSEDEKENSTNDQDRVRKREEEIERSAEELLPQKRQRTIKSCDITGDKILMDIAKEVSDKWNEVGISLGIGFKTLQSNIGSLGNTVPDHRKAFLMLQEWKSRAVDSYTYKTLATGLEENGLNMCAQKFCYT